MLVFECQVSGGEGRRDSVGVCAVERRLRFQLKANVYKGSSGRFWLLHGSRMRSILLTSPLLRKPVLRQLSQTVLLLFLLLLRENTSVRAAFSTVYSGSRLCANSFKVWLYSYLHMKLTYETQGCATSYLFLNTVVLVDSVLVFRSSDAEQRGQSLSHVVTRYGKHTQTHTFNKDNFWYLWNTFM